MNGGTWTKCNVHRLTDIFSPVGLIVVTQVSTFVVHEVHGQIFGNLRVARAVVHVNDADSFGRWVPAYELYYFGYMFNSFFKHFVAARVVLVVSIGVETDHDVVSRDGVGKFVVNVRDPFFLAIVGPRTPHMLPFVAFQMNVHAHVCVQIQPVRPVTEARAPTDGLVVVRWEIDVPVQLFHVPVLDAVLFEAVIQATLPANVHDAGRCSIAVREFVS